MTTERTVITVGPVVEAPNVFADYFDGATAKAQRVELRMDDGARALVLLRPEAEEEHWPLAEIRGVPDQAGEDLLAFALASDPLARLVVRDPRAITTLKAKCQNLGKRPPAKGLKRLAMWSVGAVASVALIVLVLVPLMANQLATLLPAKGEEALGETTFNQVRQALDQAGTGLPICESGPGLAALAKMQRRIEGDDTLPYDLKVFVLDGDDDFINAFALPGGYIVFFDGLIKAASHPDEVAAVFAHELGHVVNRDPTRNALRSAGSIGVLGLLFGDFAGGAVVLFLTNRLIEAQYTQSAEAGADEFAHERLRDVGIPPSALGGLFQTLKEQYGDQEGIVRHFASHPQLGDRIEAAIEATDGMSGETIPSLSPEEFKALQAVCG